MKVSVIVPCYNVAPWLPGCLDSILNQTHADLEVIAIDDGSTDETGAIIDQYATRDSRVVAIHQANAGLVAVREKGIAVATGDYIGFVDGDDTIEPDMYARLVRNAVQYGADISHCGMAFLWPDGRYEAHFGTGKIMEQDRFSGVRDLLLGQNIEPSLCNKLYARALVADSCLDPSVLNNEDLLRNYVLFSRSRKSVYEDFCGYRYYQRPGSMSKDQAKIVNSFRHIEKARHIILNHCDPDIYPYAMRAWLSLYVNQVNAHCHSADPQLKAMCVQCRSVLKQETRNIRRLIPRQQLAAYLIIFAPWLHKIVYKLYSGRR